MVQLLDHEGHSEYSPSQLERIILCPGSVDLCRAVPKLPTSPYAAEGTLLHSYTQQILEMWPEIPDLDYGSFEHEAAVIDAVNYVRTHVDFDEPGLRRFQELKVRMEQFEDVYGTLDYASISPTRLDIADFKFGRGIEVGIHDNPQILAYLDGFLYMLKTKYPALHEMAMTVPWYVHIVQPRIENYQWEQVFPRDLRHFNALIDRTLRLANSVNPPFSPGEAQCRWCDAGGVCRVRMERVRANQLESLRAFAEVQNGQATLDEIQDILGCKQETLDAFKAIEQYIFLELAKGKEVPKFKLVRGRSNRTWASHVDFDTLTENFPELDEVSEKLLNVKLRGPAQVEKLLTSARRKELEQFIVKPEGKLTLAPIDSPKEAVVISDPATAFADFVDTE